MEWIAATQTTSHNTTQDQAQPKPRRGGRGRKRKKKGNQEASSISCQGETQRDQRPRGRTKTKNKGRNKSRRRNKYGARECKKECIDNELTRAVSDVLPETVEFYNNDLEDGFDVLWEKDFLFPTELFRNRLAPDDAVVMGTEPCSPQRPEFLEAETVYNATRNKLNGKDINIWHETTRFTNFTQDVMPTVRRRLGAELCTQAWCKMMEMACSHNLLQPSPSPEDGVTPCFRSFHLCEAPGGFVSATNHYLCSNYGEVDWDWLAITLNPYYEGNDSSSMVDDDEFIAHTLDHWAFGATNTGDICHCLNFTSFCDAARARLCGNGGVLHLVTADGSIDCSGAPNLQEMMVHRLHFTEAVMALATLSKGGAMVLKMFTFFQNCSANLLYLLGCHFDELHVTKPATSKGGNAETYIVAKGFRGVENRVISRLISLVVSPQEDKALFPSDFLPVNFWSCVLNCATQLSGYSRTIIERNLRLEGRMTSADKKRMRDIRMFVAHRFIARFELSRIEEDMKIVPFASIGGFSLNTGKQVWGGAKYAQGNRMSGTLEERKQKKAEYHEFLQKSGGHLMRDCFSQYRSAVDALEEDGSSGHLAHSHEMVVHDHSETQEDADEVNDMAGVKRPRIDQSDDAEEALFKSPRTDQFQQGRHTPMSFGERLLRQSGWKEGKGLGKDEGGVKHAISIERLQPNQGLGFSRGRSSLMCGEVPDAPFFFTFDGKVNERADLGGFFPLSTLAQHDVSALGPYRAPFLSPSKLVVTTGEAFNSVTTCKFAQKETLRDLKAARETHSRLKAQAGEMWMPLLKQAFLSYALESEGSAVAGSLVPFLRHVDVYHPFVEASVSSVLFHGDLAGNTDLSAACALQYPSLKAEGRLHAISVPHTMLKNPAQELLPVAIPDEITCRSCNPLSMNVVLCGGIDIRSSSNRNSGLISAHDAKERLALVKQLTYAIHLYTMMLRVRPSSCASNISSPQEPAVFSVIFMLRDFFDRFIIGLVYLARSCFHQVRLFKPFTLRPDQAECALVCRGFLALAAAAKQPSTVCARNQVAVSFPSQRGGQGQCVSASKAVTADVLSATFTPSESVRRLMMDRHHTGASVPYPHHSSVHDLRLGACDLVVTHLMLVIESLLKEVAHDSPIACVLEVVSVSSLLEPSFMRHVALTAERLAQREVSAVSMLQKMLKRAHRLQDDGNHQTQFKSWVKMAKDVLKGENVADYG